MFEKRLCLFFRVICVMLGFFLVISSMAAAEAAPRRIVITNLQWDSQMFHNELAKFVIENGFDGFVVDYSVGSTALNWQAMIHGDVDVNIETWADNLPFFPEDVARGDIVPLGVLVPDSAQGFYVPRYVIEGDPERGIEPMTPTLRHVADLVRYAHVFPDPDDPARARIYGGIPGWEITEIMHRKVLHYGLDTVGFNYFRVGSEPILFTSLDAAYNLGEPWVGYLWEPSSIVGRLDLVVLEDEPFDPVLYEQGATEIPRQALLNVSGGHFPEKAPELLDFFRNFKTGSGLVSEALAYLEDTGESHINAAKWFLRTNDNLLDEWLTPEQAERVRSALARP